MTVQELLKSRYKVKSTYPYTPWEVDMILVVAEDGELYSIIHGWVASKSIIKEDEAKKHTHIFESLMWWEYREESDLPKYLKVTPPRGGEQFCFKIGSIEEYYNDTADIPHDSYIFKGLNIQGEEIEVPAIFTTPITEEEYNNYINQ